MLNVVALIVTVSSASSHRLLLDPSVLAQAVEKLDGKPVRKSQLQTSELIEANASYNQPISSNDAQPLMHSVDLGWLNGLLRELWPEVTQAINEIVRNTVNPLLASSLPVPLDALQVEPFTFPTAPTLGPIKVYGSNDGIKIKVHVHLETFEKITMSAGSGLVSAGIDSLSLRGQLVIHLAPLIGTLPVVGGVRIYFIDPPQLQMHFSGLALIAEIPGVDGLVRDVINAAISRALVLPNVLGIPLGTPEQGVDPSFLDQPAAIGILRVTIIEAKNLPQQNWSLFASDPYVTVDVGDNSWSTPAVKSNLNPVWTEQNWHDFVVYDKEQTVGLSVYDSNILTNDDFMGKIVPDSMRYGEVVGRTWTARLLDVNGETGVGSLTVKFEELDPVKCSSSFKGLVILVNVESISLPASVATAASALVTISGKSKPTGVGRMPLSAAPVLEDVVRRMHERSVPVNLISEYTGLTKAQVDSVIAPLSKDSKLNLHIGSKLYFPNLDLDFLAEAPMTINILDQSGVSLAEDSLDLAQLGLLQGLGTEDGCVKGTTLSFRLAESGEKILVRFNVQLLSHRE